MEHGRRSGAHANAASTLELVDPIDRDRRLAQDAAERLTPREREILRHLAQGAGTKEIAERMQISPNTVRSHVRATLWKLGVNSRLRAVALALRHELVSIPSP